MRHSYRTFLVRNRAEGSKIKISFSVFSLGWGGGERVLFEVTNRLVDRGHSVVFTSLGHPHERWHKSRAELMYVNPGTLLLGFRKFVLQRFRPLWDYDFESALAKAIPECDVNVATFCLTAYPTFRSGKGDFFYYVQAYEPPFFRNREERIRAKLSYFLPMKKLVVSLWLHKLMKRMTGESPFYVGDGVDTHTFYPRQVNRQSSEKVVLSFFSGLPIKGENIFIEAMNILAKRVPHVRLVGVASREVSKRLVRSKRLRLRFDIVDWIHNDDELSKLYSSADVFACAPYAEGFGLPPLESMACGTPVATTKCVGLKEYALNECNALLSPVGDSEKLAENIGRLLTEESLAERLRKNGLETAKKYTWDRVVDRVESAFKTALSR